MENGREQTETDGDGRRMFENKFYVTLRPNPEAVMLRKVHVLQY